jgi:CheY-like chemotaxis protein
LNLEFEMVDFAGLVEAAITAAEMSFVEKKVRVVHSITEGDAYVYGDPVRLQQIVTNLLNNALKFTGDGGQVEVLLARESSRIVLTVQDNGMGIERDELERVFDRFRQGRESARRVKGGLGLGLAIAKELVEAHRGTIHANSDGAGRGARFTVELPAAEAPLVSARPATALGPQLGPVRVLVVDDEPDIVELTRHVLEISGARVHTATGAKDALLLLEEHEFDLFLSDIGLPEHDGLALIREVRARGFTPERLPAIAITGYATRADDDLALAAGFQLHLAKPLDPRSLLQAIATMVPRPEAPVS